MSTPANDNEFLYELELEVRTELTQAETGQPEQDTGSASAAEGLLDPDAERYEVSLRTLLGAIEAMEDGSHPDDHPPQAEVPQSAASHRPVRRSCLADTARRADRGKEAMDRHDRESERNLLPEQRQPAARSSQEDGPSDAELLSRHTAGDRDAFGVLFGRHRDRLWAVAVRTLGDPEEAADALQDAVIAAFRLADGFRGDSAVTTWLHRIVVNSALDRMRRRAARRATACPDETALVVLANADRPATDPSGSSDTAIDVRTALQQLVPEQQAALDVDMLGYPVADAARVLGVSERTVKRRAVRGRARLLPRLEHLRPAAVPKRGRKQSAARRVHDRRLRCCTANR
jgi:RNA polymerase sigma-70 factor, ECF subfamily